MEGMIPFIKIIIKGGNHNDFKREETGYHEGICKN